AVGKLFRPRSGAGRIARDQGPILSMFSLISCETPHTTSALFLGACHIMSAVEDRLSSLRREIDEIDDKLHDLIVARMEAVAKVGKAKSAASQDILRPAREAAILRRLIERHTGSFPKAGLVRIWRE